MESRGFMDNRKHMGKDKDGVIFPVALPPLDSDMANQVFKDPYLFDF